jgi:hypothetical protein
MDCGSIAPRSTRLAIGAKRLPGPPHLKPALGGVLAGLLGMQGWVEVYPEAE